MNTTLPRPKAVQVLKALRSGSTPAAFALELAVWQTPWFQTAIQLLDELADCEHFDVRFVRRYGGGKTHFLRCLQSEAKARGWATAYVLLKHGEVELDRFNTIVAEIADKLELPEGKRGLPLLLKQALLGIAKRNGYDPAGPMSFKMRANVRNAPCPASSKNTVLVTSSTLRCKCAYTRFLKRTTCCWPSLRTGWRRRIADRRSERTVFISQSAENQGIAACLEAVGPRRRGTAHPPLRVTC